MYPRFYGLPGGGESTGKKRLELWRNSARKGRNNIFIVGYGCEREAGKGENKAVNRNAAMLIIMFDVSVMLFNSYLLIFIFRLSAAAARVYCLFPQRLACEPSNQ